MSNNTLGMAVIISAPSGGGKSTIARALAAKDSDFTISVSVTTRQPRQTDIEGKDYFFKSREEFEQMIATDQLLEYAEIYNNFYGIPKKFAEEKIAEGKIVIFDIDSQGAYKLKSFFRDNSLSIFLLPPSMDVLRQRIEHRGQNLPDDLDLRMSMAEAEIAEAVNYDFIITNNDFTQTVDEIYQIIAREKGKR